MSLDTFACEGHYCAAHGTFRGRHTGEWLGFAPTGQLLELNVGMHWRVVDGLIVEAWAIFDLPRMLLPLGVDLLRDSPKEAALVSWPPPPAADASAGPAPSTLAGNLNNECSNSYTEPPGGAEAGSEGFDCPAFVIRSTDETWHARSWEATNAAVDTYFSEDWQSVR